MIACLTVLIALTAAPIVDRSAFRYARAIEKATGLVLLPLDLHALARSHNCADIRIVDRDSRQVPYVLDDRIRPLRVALPLPRRVEAGDGVSQYRLQLPPETLPAGSQFEINTTSRLFDRVVSVVRPADDLHGREETELFVTQWRKSKLELDPEPLIFDISYYGVSDVVLLRIDEGDNAPLPIASINLVVPSRALRFEHPGSELTLLYGASEAEYPRYDLALLAPRILKRPARPIAIVGGVREPPPAEQPRVAYFWTVVGAVAVALLALFARLLRA